MSAALPSWPWWLALVASAIAYGLAARAKVAFRFLSPVALEALVAKLGPERTEFLRKSLRGPTPFWFSLHVASATALLAFVVVLFAGDVGVSVAGQFLRVRPTGGLAHDLVLFAALGVVAVAVEFVLPVVAARVDAERFIERSLPVIGLVHRVLYPLTRVLARWCHEEELDEQEEETKEEEVDAFIDVGTREGIIEEAEGELVRNLVTFGDTRVREIMTARTDIVGIESSASVRDLVQLMAKSRFSRIPLHAGQLDDIVGVVTLKDAVAALEAGRGDQPAATLMRAPFIVPESKRVAELLRDFQAKRQQLAVVVDEYGGTAGLVTLEDLLEEIVGEIREEHEEGEDITRDADGSLLVRGRASLHDVGELLESDLTHGDSSTIGGMLMALWDRVPLPGEAIEHSGHRFEVVQADRKRALLVRITRVAPAAVQEQDAAEDRTAW